MKIFFRLVRFAKPYRRFVPIYVVFAFFATVFSLANFTFLIPLMNVLFDSVPEHIPTSKPTFSFDLNWVTQTFQYYFYNTMGEGGKIAALKLICFVLFCSVLLANLFRYLSQRVLANMRTHLIFNIREKLFSKLMSLDLAYYHSRRKGDMMSVLSNDLQEVENSVVNALIVVAREPFTIIGFFVLLFTISVKLTLFSLTVLPLSFIIIAEITKRLKKSARESQQMLGALTATIDESITGIRVIQAFGAEEYMKSRFQSENNALTRLIRKVFYKRELASPMSEFMGVSVITLLLYYGGSIVLSGSGELTGSQFIAYLALYSQVLGPAKNISNTFTSIQKGIVSGERIFKIIDAEEQVKNADNAKEIEYLNHQIELNNVSFAYHPEEGRKALDNISIQIKKGETLALVGQSGSGKSTLADLIMRFYDPIQGNISLDGIDLKEISLNSLRTKIGFVNQESILFNDTIYNNIAFGWPEATPERVEQAAIIANAHEFIVKSEQGYQTKIGDRGVKLSGGQRQRLSIARAVLRNPPILILDEATSALDSESERLVQEALVRLMENRTSIVIAHRLSTIRNADRIAVLENGKIVELGNHKELIEKQGVYNKLIQLQSFK